MDDVDNREFRCELIETMYEELPAPKKKVSTQYGQGTTGEAIVREYVLSKWYDENIVTFIVKHDETVSP